MIDFKRLANESPEEREARRAARDAEQQKTEIAADAARRAEWSKTTIVARLVEDVELRSPSSGDDVATLRCVGDDGGPFTASYWLPPHRPDARDVAWRTLRSGASVRLAGYWKTRQWNDRTGMPHESREFQAQFVAVIEHGRD